MLAKKLVFGKNMFVLHKYALRLRNHLAVSQYVVKKPESKDSKENYGKTVCFTEIGGYFKEQSCVYTSRSCLYLRHPPRIFLSHNSCINSISFRTFVTDKEPVCDSANTEVEELKVQNVSEVRDCLQKYPAPKSILHNFYTLLSEDLKDMSLKVEPVYKKTTSKSVHSNWICSYYLKWPKNVKITCQAATKKTASTLAAGKALDFLMKLERISPEGHPLVYNKEEFKSLTKQKQKKLLLDSYSLEKMKNIIALFDEEMKLIVECVNYNNCLLDSSSDFISEEPGDVNFKGDDIKFFGSAKYLAKEKVELPISSYKDSFIDLIHKHNCVIVKGEPGCGKSSRIPQYVLESWIKEASEHDFCRVAVTQPRRIAAISLSDRVSSERDEQVGHIVGYQVRLKSNFHSKTGRILYCTTGILLRHLQSDPTLSKFSHVILDEAHERDVNTDLLMNLLKTASKRNNRLKLVVMSATIDVDAFSKYFDGAPIFSVPGFTYPVEKYFLDATKYPKSQKMCEENVPQVVHEEVVRLITDIHKSRPEGAILVFLPGWEDFKKVDHLLSFLKQEAVVYFVHSKLKDSEQQKIFSRPPLGIRKIILATNIAETSITIDDVKYVVDSGIHKDLVFDFHKGVNIIDMAWISKASANQRAGRAGRCAPGECFRLYSQERYNMMPDYTAPKILNTSLTKVVLDSKVLTNDMSACDFMESLITPPEKSAVEKAVEELKQLELLDESEKLTPLGKTLVNFQLEPSLAKALVNGVVFKCVTPILDIVTLFSSETDIFGSTSLTDKETIKTIKRQLCPSSDHLALMRIYEKWLGFYEEMDYNRTQRFCQSANLVPYKLEFVKKLNKIHLGYLENGLNGSVPISNEFSDNDEMVKAVLYSGTGKILEHRTWDVAKSRLKNNVNVLVTRNNHKATISMESVNFKRNRFPSDFLVYINETRSNIRRTTTVRECSLIPPISVLLFTNNDLVLEQVEDSNDVIIVIKNTKLKFLCDKEQAETLISCKRAIHSSYKYLIHQVTHANENIEQFLTNWDDLLRNVSSILYKHKVDK